MRAFVALMILAAGLIYASPAQAQEGEIGPVYQAEDRALLDDDHQHVELQEFELLANRVTDTFGDKPNIFLSYDDGSSALTIEFLDLLDQYPQVKVTLFPNCREAVPGTFQRIIDGGHAIGNHSCNHLYLTDLSSAERRRQLTMQEEYVNARLREPIDIACYRPPFGATSDAVRADAAAVGYHEWKWSVDPRDWEYPGVAHILATLKSMGDGDVIVMHDSAGKEQTLEATRQFLAAHADDYIFRTLPGCGLAEQQVQMPWDPGPACVGPYPCTQIGFADTNGWFELRQGLGTDVIGATGFNFGNPGDFAFMGDWNCDGIDTPGLYRQSDGFVYLRNSNTQGTADIEFFFGNPGDVPLAGDWNGDGCDTVSLYRKSEGRVYIVNRLGNGNGGLGAAEYGFNFGNPQDKPFAGDFDGNGVDTVGLHRESTGFVYLRNSNAQGMADLSFFFGNPGDRLAAGDWDGNGTDTVAVFRPSGSAWYFKLNNGNGAADHAISYGDWATQPLAGVFG